MPVGCLSMTTTVEMGELQVVSAWLEGESGDWSQLPCRANSRGRMCRRPRADSFSSDIQWPRGCCGHMGGRALGQENNWMVWSRFCTQCWAGLAWLCHCPDLRLWPESCLCGYGVQTVHAHAVDCEVPVVQILEDGKALCSDKVAKVSRGAQKWERRHLKQKWRNVCSFRWTIRGRKHPHDPWESPRCGWQGACGWGCRLHPRVRWQQISRCWLEGYPSASSGKITIPHRPRVLGHVPRPIIGLQLPDLLVEGGCGCRSLLKRGWFHCNTLVDQWLKLTFHFHPPPTARRGKRRRIGSCLCICIHISPWSSYLFAGGWQLLCLADMGWKHSDWFGHEGRGTRARCIICHSKVRYKAWVKSQELSHAPWWRRRNVQSVSL